MDDNSSDTNSSPNDNNVDLMKKSYSYPDHDDPNIQNKLYEKREFYYNRIPERNITTNEKDATYEEIKEYRDSICARPFTLHEHQGMLSNLINPDTPYKGLLIFHGLGTGKCILGTTLININNHVYPIEGIWNNHHTTITSNNHEEWSTPNEPLTVLSYNGYGLVTKRVLRLYREKVSTTLREIELSNGTSVTITQVHKLLKTNDECAVWTNNLWVGDTILVHAKLQNILTPIQITRLSELYHEGYVYDLEIEDTHNYAIANGILCHNTCVGVSIAEKFKQMVQKYGTKIYILVPGPIIKEHWKNSLIFCTGETYKKYQDNYVQMDENEKAKLNKQAVAQALQYYKIMSFRSFYKRVLGEKIVEEKVAFGEKTRTTYRKTEKGEFERDIAVDRIYNLNNSLIIVDEAHNLTGNAYGLALREIIDKSFNLKVVLMSATPMKNLGSDIIELINFLRPIDSPIERDRIFNAHYNHLMDFKEGGVEYFKKMINGYISHVRGSDPLTFAKRVDKGTLPEGLLFTNVKQCRMLPFQRATYDIAVKISDDALDRKSEAVANFVFPGLSKDKQTIVGYYGRNGLATITDQLKSSYDELNKKIGDMFFDGKETTGLIDNSNDGNSISGKILKMPWLKLFSIKFYKALKKINRLIEGKRGAQTAFVYSNLVKVGIEMFREVLLQNGYLEFQEDMSSYVIDDTILCYYCGKTKRNHAVQLAGKRETDTPELKISDSSTEYEKITNEETSHKFYPATFITITGRSSEEKADTEQEDKKRILDTYFNKVENRQGKYIKLVLGSRVMNEGVSMKNVGEVHLLDVYFNLGKVDQVVGRAIRWCSHYKPSDAPYFPEVLVYKYVVTLNKGDGLSSEEELYKKAEMKYMIIKKLERAMKEKAIDCPLNINGNIFFEEIKEHEGCEKKSGIKCPAVCDYQKCHYKCDDQILNEKYYDPKRKIYKKIRKENLDYSTFTHKFAEFEIEYAKNKIKELFILHPVYKLLDIIVYVKDSYNNEKRELFDEFFVYKALDALIPINENDTNNFKDTIIDKNNVAGYLIYRDQYYIFQPFDQSELVPLIYRTTNTNIATHKISLYNYMKNIDKYRPDSTVKLISETETPLDDIKGYNFDDNMEYYDDRDENEFVGIVDKEISRRKNKRVDEINDVFKIREQLPKVLDKKRGTGIPSLKGAVCSTSKSTKYLTNVAKKLGIIANKLPQSRTDICNIIEKEMLLKEKYGTTAKKDKLTFVRLPTNHPLYPFPYNLEDRVQHTTDKIKSLLPQVTVSTSTFSKKSGQEKGYPSYVIAVKPDKADKQKSQYYEILKSVAQNVTEKDGAWEILIE